MFLDNPLGGVGPGSSKFAISHYQPPEKFYGVSMGGRALHSAHFQLLSELAVPGVIIFGSLMYWHFRSILEIRRCPSGSTAMAARSPSSPEAVSAIHTDFLRWAAIGFGGGLVGYLGAGAFVSVLYYPHVWILSGILVAIHLIWNNLQSDRRLSRDQYKGTGRYVEALRDKAVQTP